MSGLWSVRPAIALAAASLSRPDVDFGSMARTHAIAYLRTTHLSTPASPLSVSLARSQLERASKWVQILLYRGL